MSLQVRARWAERGLDVDLDLPPGRHAITGPNGAGKSSLLAVIAGLERADSSRLVLDGRPLDGLPRTAAAWCSCRRPGSSSPTRPCATTSPSDRGATAGDEGSPAPARTTGWRSWA
ncbi:ATP-binding cassette domain-containing protein [Janibacter limosus]|nr:ATP-binding cassette domain-containing protein [Janibacter limosus]WKV16669.1 ATP-binding cassette domain-containing protein [Janibacter limosus]